MNTDKIKVGDIIHLDSDPNLVADWCRGKSYEVAVIKGGIYIFITKNDANAAGLDVYPDPYFLSPKHEHIKNKLIDVCHCGKWICGIGTGGIVKIETAQVKNPLGFWDNSHKDPPRPENSPWEWL